MIGLAESVFTIILDEFGEDFTLARLADPFFFQACSNALGFDWDSSGSTTVTCSVLKRAFANASLPIRAAGGKGRHSRQAISEISAAAKQFDLSEDQANSLSYASKMCAKVDNAAIQGGYPIYHHTLFVAQSGRWAVVQQGMNSSLKMARRYHWLSDGLRSFVDRPHRGIVGEVVHKRVLDMTARESEQARRMSTDLAQEGPERIRRLFQSIRPSDQGSLNPWTGGAPGDELVAHYSVIPKRVDWDGLRRAYDVRPSNYEALLSIDGVGPATVRGLALISELIYGRAPSWSDPVRFCFAYGGKDGVPFPVERRAMDESIRILRTAIEGARVGDRERLQALDRLRVLAPKAF